MTEPQGVRFDRLLDTLEANAVANTKLATEVGQVCQRVESLTTEVRESREAGNREHTSLAAEVDRSTSATNKLVHEIRCVNSESKKKTQTRTEIIKGVGLWAGKNVDRILMAALAVWLLGYGLVIGPSGLPLPFVPPAARTETVDE